MTPPTKGSTGAADDAGAAAGSAYAFVGDRLRTLRKNRGLTQAEVARIISVSPQQYQKYEDAQSKCSLTTLIALAKYYAVPLGALLPSIGPDAGPDAPAAETPPARDLVADIPTEADLLARLVTSFVKLRDIGEKTRLVELVEAIQIAHEKSQ